MHSLACTTEYHGGEVFCTGSSLSLKAFTLGESFRSLDNPFHSFTVLGEKRQLKSFSSSLEQGNIITVPKIVVCIISYSIG